MTREDQFHANEGLIHYVIRRYRLYAPPPFEEEDLFSAGAVGLWRATASWDPERGGTFATYAVWRIRGAISAWRRSLGEPPPRTLSTEALTERRGDAWEPALEQAAPEVNEEQLEAVRMAVARLNDADREMVRSLWGGSPRELARRRGTTPQAVYNQRRRLINTLRWAVMR